MLVPQAAGAGRAEYVSLAAAHLVEAVAQVVEIQQGRVPETVPHPVQQVPVPARPPAARRGEGGGALARPLKCHHCSFGSKINDAAVQGAETGRWARDGVGPDLWEFCRPSGVLPM